MKRQRHPSLFRQVKAPAAAVPSLRELRFARLPSMPGMPADAARRLDNLRVLLVGAGSIGRPIAQHLARLAVGSLAIIDPKANKAENLLTQPTKAAELGAPKAQTTAREAKSISPATDVAFHVGLFEQLALADLAGFDLVFLAVDNLAAEAAVGQSCMNLGLPLIHGAVHGPSLVAQVRVYGNRDAGSVTPACRFSDDELDMLDRQVRFSCDAAPGPATPAFPAPATASTSSLAAIAAGIAATQMLRLVLDLGEPVADTQVEFCAFTNRAVTSALRRRRHCRCDHARYRVVRLPRPLADHSPGQLAALLGADESLTDFEFGDHLFVEAAICPAGHRRKVRRLLAAGETSAGTCDRCGATLQVQPFYAYRQTAPAHLGAAMDLPLGKLGAPGLRWALVRGGRSGVLALSPDGI